jgi:hypothetical protein
VDALAESVHEPGPPRGTSTDSKPGPSAPESSPLSAFAFDIGATRLTLVVVTLEKLLTSVDVVTGVFAVVLTVVDGLVVVWLVVVVT